MKKLPDRWLTLRVPMELHERIKLAAEEDDRSISYIVRRVLKQQFSAERGVKTPTAA